IEEAIQHVIDTVTIREMEVQDRERKWYLLRIRPYWTMDKRIDGAVLILMDIDPLKRSLEQVNRARDYAQTLVETVRESLVVLDEKMHIRTANHAFDRTFEPWPLESDGRPVFELSDWSDRAASLLGAARGGEPQNGFQTQEIEVQFQAFGHRTLLVNARRVRLPRGGAPLLLLAHEDTTERKAAETELRASGARSPPLLAGGAAGGDARRGRVRGGDPGRQRVPAPASRRPEARAPRKEAVGNPLRGRPGGDEARLPGAPGQRVRLRPRPGAAHEIRGGRPGRGA